MSRNNFYLSRSRRMKKKQAMNDPIQEHIVGTSIRNQEKAIESIIKKVTVWLFRLRGWL